MEEWNEIWRESVNLKVSIYGNTHFWRQKHRIDFCIFYSIKSQETHPSSPPLSIHCDKWCIWSDRHPGSPWHSPPLVCPYLQGGGIDPLDQTLKTTIDINLYLTAGTRQATECRTSTLISQRPYFDLFLFLIPIRFPLLFLEDD